MKKPRIIRVSGRNPLKYIEEMSLPGALYKSIEDCFEYTLHTKSGLVFNYEQAEIFEFANSIWVHLKGVDICNKDPEGRVRNIPRGVDIKLEEIAVIYDTGKL